MISIIIIGNEILSASVKDTNLAHMLEKLSGSSYSVDEVRIIRDDVATIAATVQELSRKSRFVVSSGGVGPTHDDVTLEAYAAAFGESLILHPELEQRIRLYFGDHIKESSLRMARVPANTQLIDMGPKSWPLIQVANCFVLPGLPEIFVKKFAEVMRHLPEVPDHFAGALFTSWDESSFAAYLTSCQHDFDGVEIGSYPTYDRSSYAARVTFKGTDRDQVQKAFHRMHAHFQNNGVLVGAREIERVS
ncbi:MAG: molybdopterin-binding protein [Acidobacteriota bacterium]|nr:molybdopterin-binding protein [Acidobacteriota bacterium]